MTPALSAPSLLAWFERYGWIVGPVIGLAILANAADVIRPA